MSSIFGAGTLAVLSTVYVFGMAALRSTVGCSLDATNDTYADTPGTRRIASARDGITGPAMTGGRQWPLLLSRHWFLVRDTSPGTLAFPEPEPDRGHAA